MLLAAGPPTLEDTGMFAEGTGHLDAASGFNEWLTAAAQSLIEKEDGLGQKAVL